MELDPGMIVRETAELDAMYGEALERSVRKQMAFIDALARQFIAASPMVMIGTEAEGSADVSPRGDAPGFVQVADDHTLLIPDRRGNNRLDSLRNIVRNPKVGLLFLVPGVAETFRVNGEGYLSRDPELTRRFEVQGKLPRTVLVVKVQEAYVHCSRALVRSDLWNPAKFADRASVPSFGTMLEAHTKGFVEANFVDEDAKVRVPATLY
ncbi:MAG: pyridoxamine 5-phosphate oxidase-related FMN-binding protein [Bryobacterales bacterium]|nr:pyridoxamine 5-phosphate oxidase-related FMN-binding protein [Bryobacterales bacterium]